jgi:signal transduction histidine kinase
MLCSYFGKQPDLCALTDQSKMCYVIPCSASMSQNLAAEVADREISEFLLHACHDLRSSLRAIRAHAELLLKRSEARQPSDFEQALGFIVDGAQRIDLLADGLTNYSIALQLDKGSFRPTRLDVLLRTVLARADKEIRENGAEVTYDGLPRVSGSPDRLMQVFENLICNALRHRGSTPPRIHITAERQSAHAWVFRIQDNGPGVEAVYLEGIFKPFERLHGKKNAGPGLGLTICREIVERHGGAIWAEAQPGSGLTALFTLPAE